MAWHTLCLLMAAVVAVQAQTIQEKTCSRSQNSVDIQPGSSALLGGILTLNQGGSDGYGCGGPYNSMQALEAIRWVLDLLNKKNEFLQTEFLTNTYVPGVTLGMRVVNNCNSRGSSVAGIRQIYESFSGNAQQCQKENNKMVFGIVGGSTSDQAGDLSLALAPHDIPLVSYEATAPQLTLSGMYPNFMRTVAPDNAMTEVIVQVMIRLNWKYVTVVYDTGTYGKTSYTELLSQMVKNGLCLTAGVPMDGSDLSDANMDSVINQVLSSEATGVVFFGVPNQAKALIRRLGDSTKIGETGRLQWMFSNFPIESGLNIPYMRGIISVTDSYRMIVEFEDHWVRINESNPSAENPWFQSWFAQKYECSFTPTGGQKHCESVYGGMTETEKEEKQRAEYQQDQFVEPAVMAVFTYARALRMAQQSVCGATSTTACPALINMDRKVFYENYLKKVDFVFSSDERVPSLASNNILPYNAAKRLSFTDQGDIKQPRFTVWNYNDIEFGKATGNYKFKTIGSYSNQFLELNQDLLVMYDKTRQMRLTPNPTSPCPSDGCKPCKALPADVKYYYEPGDVIINGVFSLHNKGTETLTCGNLKSSNQVMYLEAMIYAIRSINNDNAILPNIKLGGLGLDDCSSSLMGQSIISQIHRKQIQVKDTHQVVLDPETIDAYTAAHESSQTDPLAEMTNQMKRPLVAYRSGSSKLDDRAMYPYFIRSVPYAREEIQAIILILKNYGWMHVQLVVSDSAYSQDASKLFKEMAAKEGICVVATHNLGHAMDTANKAVAALALNQDVPVTVALMEMMGQHWFIEALHAHPVVRANLTLISSLGWGTKPQLIKGKESTADGVISLSLKSSTLQTFQTYLRQLRASSHLSNPWFKEWFAAAHNCSLDTVSQGKPACDLTKTINEGDNFEVMHEVISVINGVKALAIALDRTLASYCGSGYTRVCSSYTTAADKGLRLMSSLRGVTFPIENMMPDNTFRFVGSAPAIPFHVNNYRNGAYQQVGTIQAWDKVSSFSSGVLVHKGQPVSEIKTRCPPPCLMCAYVFNHQDYIANRGDINLGAIFNIHYTGSGIFSCGDLRLHNGALYPEVFEYAVNRINQGQSRVRLNNVKLGYLGYDGCSNPARASTILNSLITGRMHPPQWDPRNIMAWVTYESATSKHAAMTLNKIGTPLVSPATTLSEKYRNGTFFSTISSDLLVVRGMADYVKRMGWKYVYVINSPDDANRESAKMFRDLLKEFGACVLSQYEFVTDGSVNVILSSLMAGDSQVVAVFAEPDQHINEMLQAKSTMTSKTLTFLANRPWLPYARDHTAMLTASASVFFQIPSPTVADFLTYVSTPRDIRDTANPWLDELYEELFSCDFPGTFTPRQACASFSQALSTSPLFHSDIWVLPTITAIEAIAEGLHRTLTEKCGASYSGVCLRFMHDADTRERLMFHMDEETFVDIQGQVFDFVQRMSNQGYVLHRYAAGTTTVKEGDLPISGSLTLADEAALKTRYVNVKSECPNSCLICRDNNADIQAFSFIPGDMYIVGLFDVHKKGNSPFDCGELNMKHGALLLEAFNFALDYVNRGQGIFAGIEFQLGGIGLDMCQSPSRAAKLVANIQSGQTVIRREQATITPREIEAYVATMDTASSIRVADILQQLLVPQISYGATGMELLNREKYSYFLRSVPADDKMGRAIISYLKKFEYNNIQVIKSFDEIGLPGAKEFERLAEINLVCITKTFLIGESGNITGDMEAIVSDISGRFQARVVVLWMKNPLPVLKVINKYPALYRDTLFVGTDKWGWEPSYLDMVAIRNILEAQNLILLDVETADVPGMDTYLSDKTPDNYMVNPWFKDTFEAYQKCDWDAGTCNKYLTIPRLDHYVQDPYALYVVNAVFSAAMGIRGAVRELCAASSSSGLCNFYAVNGERRQKVLKYLNQVNFVDDTHQPFFYTADGQSDRGFHFYNVTNPNNTLKYENVGSYNDTNFLKLDITYGNNFTAKCDPTGTKQNMEKCVCPFKPDIDTRYMKKTGGRGLSLVYVGDIHKKHEMDPYKCGKINTGADLHRLLAFFYAIQRINTNKDFDLPNSIRLDGLALDSCSSTLRLGQDVYNVLSGNKLCDTDDTGVVIPPASIVSFIVDKDKNALPISSMLSPQGIPIISPTATHSLLDDPFHHATFLRTQGSDRDLNKVILSIGKQLNWNMIGVIYSDSPAHQAAKNTLLQLAKSSTPRMCVGSVASLSMTAGLSDATDALDAITQTPGVTGVVLFVEPAHFRLIMESSQRLGSTGLVWVIPNNWDTLEKDVETYRSELSSSIWIQSKTAIVDDFYNQVKMLSLTNKMGIPDDWFQEIYQSIHKCQILDIQNRAETSYPNFCTGNEKITDQMLTHDPSVLQVIISVYAAALGLDRIKACKGEELGYAACLQLKADKYSLIYDNTRNVNFKVLPELLGDKSFDFSFTKGGNGQAGYFITTRDESGALLTLGYHNTTGLKFNKDMLQQTTSFNQGDLPISKCAPGAICQCHGPNGQRFEFSPEGVRLLENVQVGQRYRNPENGKIVLVNSIPNTDDRFDDIWAIIIMVLAGIGAVLAFLMFVFLLVMYPVRGGTSILGYIVSFGIILLYLMVFAFIAHADEQICALRRFGLGIVYAIVYGALLVKLIDCWRVRGKDLAKYNKLGRPLGLFFVVVFLVLVQAMINIEWLILEEPEMERVFYRDSYWPRCTPDDFYDEGLVLSLTYVMVLIALNFVLGIWTFTHNINHREARWIFGIAILSIPCWVIWCAVSIKGAYKMRDAAVAIGLLVNATFMLLLMPVRKLYLLRKYHVMIEEEDKQAMSDVNGDYASVYARQYDNRPQMHGGSVVQGYTSRQYSDPKPY